MRLAVNFERVDPSKGGAETYVADLCRALIAAGHEVELFANHWNVNALPQGLRLTHVPATGPTRIARIWSFARNSAAILRDSTHDCSVGFINTWEHDVLIPQGGARAGSLEANAMRFPAGWRRYLYRAAKRLNPKDWLCYRAIERRQYDPASPRRYVAVSQMVKRDLERFQKVPTGRISVIPNAIDAARLHVSDAARVRADYRARLGLRHDDVVGLFVGHNFKLKGLPNLLAALSERSKRAADARPIHFLVCGGGRIEPIRERVSSLGLDRFVHLAGFEQDVRAAFHASDFCVLPTYYDPCSLVVLEAFACGLPVITTRCNGAGELITQDREGFVIRSPDATGELVAALDAMTNDEQRGAQAAAAARLGREYAFERHAARLVELFEQVARRDKKPYAIRPHSPARAKSAARTADH